MSLLFRIKGDSTDAVKAINETKTSADGLTKSAGGLTSGLTSAINPATLVAAGLAAVAGAAIVATKALFELTKSAAAYGGEIEEAMNKTGLGAETLSALKFHADQAGISLQVVTDAAAKLSRTIGEASDGNAKAIAILAKFGVEPVEAMNDLEGTLQKVFTRIVEARSGVEQMALAQQAFGRSGANMIDFLKSFNGDIEAATAAAIKFGVVITDDAARSAAAFEDTLFALDRQLDGVAHTIGFAVLPIFLEWATKLSEFLTRNSAEIALWANAFARALRFVVDTILASSDALIGFAQILSAIALMDWNLAIAGVNRIANAVNAQRGAFENLIRVGSGIQDAGGGGPARPGLPDAPSVGTKSRGRGLDPLKEAERLERERIRQIQQNLADELELRRARDETLLADLEARVAREELTELEAARKRRLIILAQLEFQRKALQDTAELIGQGADEYVRIQRQLAVLDESITKAKIEQTANVFKVEKNAREKALAELKKTADETQRILDEIADNVNAAAEEARDRNERGQREEFNRLRRQLAEINQLRGLRGKGATELITALGAQAEVLRSFAIAREANAEAELKKEIERRRKEIEDTVKDTEQKHEILEQLEQEHQDRLANIRSARATEEKEIDAGAAIPTDQARPFFGQGGQLEQLVGQFDAEGNQAAVAGLNALQIAFEGVANAVGQAVAAWVLYGNAGASVRQVTAAILASIAQQAAVKAIFELAEGFAALFFNPAAAAAHFQAAALYGVVAASAAIVGRGVAGDKFSKQTGSATGGTQGEAPGPVEERSRFAGFGAVIEERNRPLIQAIERQTVVLGQVEETQNQFVERLEGFRPGDVLAMGAVENPDAVQSAYESNLTNDLRASERNWRLQGAF